MKKRVLLSIHPEFADAIFDGEKLFEFRRVVFKHSVDEIVVYATMPVAKVVGTFRVGEIFEDRPSALWKRTREFGGVAKEKFDAYFKDRVRGYAIQVTKPIRFASPQPLSNYLASNTPPQSFCYLS